MAISIDWPNSVINVPQADLTLISGSSYTLDVNWFRLQLKDLEDDPAGIGWPDTHVHTPPVTLSGSTYARFVEIINGYTVTFEDGNYGVALQGANNNIVDVLNRNQVSVIANNSAGLTEPVTPNDIWSYELGNITDVTQIAGALRFMYLLQNNKTVTDPVSGELVVYDSDGTTVLFTTNIFEDAAGATPYQGSGVERREKFN